MKKEAAFDRVIANCYKGDGMDRYRVYYPAEGGLPAATMDCMVPASLERGDGGRLFLAQCASRDELAANVFQDRLLCVMPVEPVESALVTARFSGERAAIRKIQNRESGAVYEVRIHRSKTVGAELLLIFSVADVLYQGMGIPLPQSVKKEDYHDFLASFDHPFFRSPIRFTLPAARTFFEFAPAEYHGDIKKAAEILKNEGACEIYLFGGTVPGKVKEKYDVDIAVGGLTREAIERASREIGKAVNINVSIFDMGSNRQFFSVLKANGGMVGEE
jgi:predicted nucleotidyltransferase